MVGTWQLVGQELFVNSTQNTSRPTDLNGPEDAAATMFPVVTQTPLVVLDGPDLPPYYIATVTTNNSQQAGLSVDPVPGGYRFTAGNPPTSYLTALSSAFRMQVESFSVQPTRIESGFH
jgi:hypothetical protein